MQLPAISAALFARFSSRQPDSPAMRAVAALRQQFGGHAVQIVEQANPVAPLDTAALDTAALDTGALDGGADPPPEDPH